MKIEKTKTGYFVKLRIRDPYTDRVVQRKIEARTLQELYALVEQAKKEIRKPPSEFFNEQQQQQSTCFKTLGQVIEYYTTHKKNMENDAILRKVTRDIGNTFLSDIAMTFDKYILKLSTEKSEKTKKILSPTTINRYKAHTKMAFNFVKNRGLIENNPLQYVEFDFEESRDRILTDDEKERLIEIMLKKKSYLYWAFYFSIRNPIRKGDLFNLTFENLDYNKPKITFYPSKTYERVTKLCYLFNIDDNLLGYFKSLPADCKWLFPRLYENGKFKKMNDFRKHFINLLSKVNIENFHWHDLKHCAITSMIRMGMTTRQIKDLGINFNDRIIDIYYHPEPNDVFDRFYKKTV